MTHGEGRQGRFVLAIGSSEPISNLELPRGNAWQLQDLLQLGRAGGTTTPSANPGARAGATERSPAAPEGAFQRQLKVKPQAAKRAKTTLKADGNRKGPVWAGSTAGARGLEGSEVAVTALLLAPDSGSRPVVGRKRGGRVWHCSWHHGGLILAPSPSHALEDVSPLHVGAALTCSIHNHPASGTKPRCQHLRFPVPIQMVTPSRAGNAGGFQSCCCPPREVPWFVAASGPLLKVLSPLRSSAVPAARRGCSPLSGSQRGCPPTLGGSGDLQSEVRKLGETRMKMRLTGGLSRLCGGWRAKKRSEAVRSPGGFPAALPKCRLCRRGFTRRCATWTGSCQKPAALMSAGAERR